MKHRNLFFTVLLICVFAAVGCKPVYREIDGSQGEQGEQGTPGADGNDAKITIGEDGYLYVNNESTGIRVKPDISIGDDGYWYIDGEDTGIKAVLDDNNDLPDIHIGDNGYWYIGSKNTGIKALPDETEPEITIDKDGYVHVNGKKTGVKAPKDDTAPEITIDNDGHICINGEKTATKIPQDETELIITIDNEGYVCINGDNTGIQTHVEVTVGVDGNILIDGEDSGVSTKPPIPASEKSTPRNLAKVVLGREVANAEDVTAVVDAIGRTIKMGYYKNLNIGDFFGLASINIQPDSSNVGKLTLTLDPNYEEGNRNLDMIIVSINPYFGKNGNTEPHVVVHSKRVLSPMTTSDSSGGYQMNSTASNSGGYMSSKGRAFVINQVKNALGEAGIPVHDTSKIIELNRKTTNNGGTSATGTITITDNVFLPTTYELFASVQDTKIEPYSGQAHFEYYNVVQGSGAGHVQGSQLKYCSIPQNYGQQADYWTSVPEYGTSAQVVNDGFAYVGTNSPGVSHSSTVYMLVGANANSAIGIAPAFAIGGY